MSLGETPRIPAAGEPKTVQILMLGTARVDDEGKLADFMPGFTNDEHGEPDGMMGFDSMDRLTFVAPFIANQAWAEAEERTGMHVFVNSLIIREVRSDGRPKPFTLPGWVDEDEPT